MKKIIWLLAIALEASLVAASSGNSSSEEADQKLSAITWPAGLPIYDHIVIVVEENKDYDQIINSPKAPYINDTLRREGANFTQMYGEEHNSQGNYFWLFSGSNQGVGFNDVLPGAAINANYPFVAPNLATSLIDKGLSFKGFAEDLPAIGSTLDCTKNADGTMIYARKHVPWISFANVPNGNEVATSSNLRFADFPRGATKFNTLPTISIVVPNQENDMHNGLPEKSIPAGDFWLKENLDAYYQWAKKNNSLLIVTFDESDNKTNYLGLTNPSVQPTSQFHKYLQNRICTIFAGAHIKPGDYTEGKGITHVNILRTLEAMYGLPRAGAQQPNAAGHGIRDDYIISDVFAGPN
jgi:phosphatidylinositol-3-phosphatase